MQKYFRRELNLPAGFTRQTGMRTLLALSFLLSLGLAALAGSIEKGATIQVKANSIWFQDQVELAHWQQLKKRGDTAALTAYQKKVLGNRDAWQFTNPLNVKILGYDQAKHQVHVEMTTEGRMQGTDWLLDPDALAQ
jgi:hypothetical protein